MKVKIPPYPSWWGPYQIAQLLRYVGVKEQWRYNVGTVLNKTPLRDLCEWIHSKRRRKIVVKVDPHDLWNLDETITILLLPLLKEYRKIDHGGPYVKDEDVPEHLRAGPDADPGTPDKHYFDRWRWVLDEIIWAFEQSHPDYADDSILETARPLSPEWRAAHQRQTNGYRLFAFYYRALWD